MLQGNERNVRLQGVEPTVRSRRSWIELEERKPRAPNYMQAYFVEAVQQSAEP